MNAPGTSLISPGRPRMWPEGTEGPPYLYGTELDGATDYWQRIGGGVATSGVGYTLLAVLRRDANADFVVQLDDGTNNERLTVWFSGGALLAVYGRTGGAIKQHVDSVAAAPTGAGNEFLAQAYIGNNADSRVYINGVDVTVHVIGLAWAGPVGIDRIQIGAGTAGAAPLLGNIRRAAVHKGAVDPELAWSLWNDSWATLQLDHLWYMGGGPRDNAATIYDEGIVGGWDVGAVGTPVITYDETWLWRGQAALLDGVNDYAASLLPYVPGTDFTVACRFKQEVAGTDIVWVWSDTTTNNRVQVYTSPGLLFIAVSVGGALEMNAGIAAITVGQWHLATLRYIAATRQVSLWLDNTLSHQAVHATPLLALPRFDLGSFTGGSTFLDGLIGDTIICTGDQSAHIAAWVANDQAPLSNLASNVIAEYNRGGEVFDAAGGTAMVNRANPGTYNMTINLGGIVTLEHPV